MHRELRDRMLWLFYSVIGYNAGHHMLQKDDNECAKKCTHFVVEGARPRDTQNMRTLREISKV